MPAYRERVYLCPGQDDQPVLIRDFPVWWDRRAFFGQFGQRRIDTGNPIYVDYVLLLTFGEAYTWDRQCREAFADDPRNQLAAVSEAMQEWETMLKKIGRASCRERV